MLKELKYSMIAGFILLGSCKEDEDFIPDYYWGEASALKNGEEWNPEVIAIKSEESFAVFIDGYLQDNGSPYMERLSIAPLPHSNGIYDLFDVKTINVLESDSIQAFYSTSFGDVLGDTYRPDNNSNNYIEILEYNACTKEIRGTFNVTLVLSKDDASGPPPPDTLKFTNGTFHTKIRDNW